MGAHMVHAHVSCGNLLQENLESLTLSRDNSVKTPTMLSIFFPKVRGVYRKSSQLTWCWARNPVISTGSHPRGGHDVLIDNNLRTMYNTRGRDSPSYFDFRIRITNWTSKHIYPLWDMDIIR